MFRNHNNEDNESTCAKVLTALETGVKAVYWSGVGTVAGFGASLFTSPCQNRCSNQTASGCDDPNDINQENAEKCAEILKVAVPVGAAVGFSLFVLYQKKDAIYKWCAGEKRQAVEHHSTSRYLAINDSEDLEDGQAQRTACCKPCR